MGFKKGKERETDRNRETDTERQRQKHRDKVRETERSAKEAGVGGRKIGHTGSGNMHW